MEHRSLPDGAASFSISSEASASAVPAAHSTYFTATCRYFANNRSLIVAQLACYLHIRRKAGPLQLVRTTVEDGRPAAGQQMSAVTGLWRPSHDTSTGCASSGILMP